VKVTHNQGFIEGLLVDALLADGLAVDRPAMPISLEISEDAKELQDPTAYPLKVRRSDRIPICRILTQVG
jgi:phenol 2-monooxygenase (NADPH)